MLLIRINFEIIESEKNQDYQNEMNFFKKFKRIQLLTPKFLEQYSISFYKPKQELEIVQNANIKKKIKKNQRSSSVAYNIDVNKIDFIKMIRRCSNGKFEYVDDPQKIDEQISTFQKNEQFNKNIDLQLNENIEILSFNEQSLDEQHPNSIKFKKNQKSRCSSAQIQHLEVKSNSSEQIQNEFNKNQNENQENQLQDNLCCICYDQDADAVYMNCGHGGLCNLCAIDLWQSNDQCYICRQEIHQILQIDQSYKNGNYFKVINSNILKKGNQCLQIFDL